MVYRDRALAQRAGHATANAVQDLLYIDQQTRDGAVLPQAASRLLADQRDDVIQIRRSNPPIYHRGGIFKVLTHLIGMHQLLLTNDAYTLYNTVDGE